MKIKFLFRVVFVLVSIVIACFLFLNRSDCYCLATRVCFCCLQSSTQNLVFSPKTNRETDKIIDTIDNIDGNVDLKDNDGSSLVSNDSRTLRLLAQQQQDEEKEDQDEDEGQHQSRAHARSVGVYAKQYPKIDTESPLRRSPPAPQHAVRPSDCDNDEQLRAKYLFYDRDRHMSCAGEGKR